MESRLLFILEKLLHYGLCWYFVVFQLFTEGDQIFVHLKARNLVSLISSVHTLIKINIFPHLTWTNMDNLNILQMRNVMKFEAI